MSTFVSATHMRSQRGLSLVELMIGVAVSLLLLGAITGVYLTGKQSYRVSEALARFQENLRFVAHVIGNDIKMAGHLGCNTKASMKTAVPLAAQDSVNVYLQGIMGYESLLPPELPPSERTGGDVLKLQFISQNAWRLNSNMADANADILIDGDANTVRELSAQSGALLTLVISECRGAETFVPNSITEGAGVVTVSHPTLSRRYETDAEIGVLESHTYYVGAGASGSALKRISAQTVRDGVPPEVISEGVEDLQILFGRDTNDDRQTDSYLSADAMATGDWQNVVSVQFCAQFSSSENGLRTERGSYTDCLGQSIASPDLRSRQVFTATVARRNLFPID